MTVVKGEVLVSLAGCRSEGLIAGLVKIRYWNQENGKLGFRGIRMRLLVITRLPFLEGSLKLCFSLYE